MLACSCGTRAVGDVRLDVRLDSGTASTADVASVEVSADRAAEHVQTALGADGPATWRGSFDSLAAGDGWVFSAVATDSSGTALFTGHAPPVTIFAGHTAQVVLELEPTTPPPAFGNHAPHIDSLFVSSVAVAPSGTVELAVGASDADSDPLVYAWTDQPHGMFSAPASATTGWSAAPEGSYALEITVTDDHEAFDTASLSIDVARANDEGTALINATIDSSPQVELVTLSTGHLEPGVAATASIVASDPDGDVLTYAWSDTCGGVWTPATTIAPAAQSSLTVPVGTTAASCAIRVDVADGHGGTNFGTLAVAVGDPIVTHDPRVDSTYESASMAGSDGIVDLRVSAHDPDGGPISIAWSAPVGTLSTPEVTATSSAVAWTAPDCYTGTATIVATVSSAYGSTTVSFEVASTIASCYVPPPVFSIGPATSFPVDGNPVDLALADFDGDGKLDIVTANYGAGTATVLRNTTTTLAAPSFATALDLGTSTYPWGIAAGDLNGDGKPDVVDVDIIRGFASVFVNASSGPGVIAFGPRQDISVPAFPEDVVVADMNGDTKLDVVIADYSAHAMTVLTNTTASQGASPTFDRVDVAIDGDPTAVAVGDFDGDGKPDVAVSSEVANIVAVVYSSTSSGGLFIARSVVDYAAGAGTDQVVVADVNRDGILDLVTANTQAASASVLLGLAGGAFAPRVDLSSGTGPWSVAAADLQGDGTPDVVVGDYDAGAVSILLDQTAAGAMTVAFAADDVHACGAAPSFVLLADVNGDQLPDVIVANHTTSSVSVLLNASH